MTGPAASRDDRDKAYVIEVQETYAARFDAWYSELPSDPYRSTFAYGRMKADRFIQTALDRLPAGARVLDVGCGTGFHVSLLRQRGFDVLGIEPGEDLRRRALQNNPGAEIVDGDVENLALDDGAFDAVLAIEVIRHVPHPDRAVREISRVLKPGGLAIITAAPKWSLNGYALINKVTSRVAIPTFTKQKQWFLSTGEARRLLLHAGFSTVEMHGVLLGPWPVVGRLSPRVLAVSLRRFEPLDDRLADHPALRGLSSQLVLIGER